MVSLKASRTISFLSKVERIADKASGTKWHIVSLRIGLAHLDSRAFYSLSNKKSTTLASLAAPCDVVWHQHKNEAHFLLNLMLRLKS